MEENTLVNDRIYLAGGATRDPKFAIEWRENVRGLLYPKFTTVSPFRGKNLDASGKWAKYEPNEIVTRDLRDIRSSGLVLVEMVFPDYNYVGTCMEIQAAGDAGIPVVLWTEHWKNHYWLRFHAVKVLPTLEECCDYIKEYWGD